MKRKIGEGRLRMHNISHILNAKGRDDIHNSLISLVLVGIMLTAFITNITLPIAADLTINNHLELEGTGIYDNFYYVGEQNQSLQVQIEDTDTNGDLTDFWCNITTTDADITFDDNGEGNIGDVPYDSTPGFDDLLWDPTVTYDYFQFQFDIEENASGGLHSATLDFTYVDGSAAMRSINFVINIKVISNATTLYVGGTGLGNYTHIQYAIENASDGDTVYVYNDSAPYYENVVVNKTINLIGEDRDTTIIDGGGSGDVIKIEVDWVNITGFNVTNSGNSGDDAGITIISNSNTIFCNRIQDNRYGINIFSSKSNNITSNNITSNGCGIIIDFSNDNYINKNELSYSQRGISLESSNGNIIISNYVFKNMHGITLDSSNDNNVTANNITSNSLNSIRLDFSNMNNLTENSVSKSVYGFYLASSLKNKIIKNRVFLNDAYGIRIDSANWNIIDNNNISRNGNGIGIYTSIDINITSNTITEDGILIGGTLLEHWNTHTIDISNTINGKPVQYWKNQTGGTVPEGAGQVILANCTNVTVENQEITNCSIGIRLGFSSNNIISNNTVNSNSISGIYLYFSNENTINNNNASLNQEYGFYLSTSHENIITNNTMSLNYLGIGTRNSYGNEINENIILSNNQDGILILESTFGDNILNNLISNNQRGIILYYSSRNNITFNTIINNSYGIYLTGDPIMVSNENNITDNSISNNTYGITLYDAANNNSISRNNVTFNKNIGIGIYSATNNRIYHNNIIGNTNQAFDDSTNFWNDSYPSGGNYWSDYDGVDLNSTPTQDVPPPDGIGDTPYAIDLDSQDDYPLIAPFGEWIPFDDTTPPTISSVSVIDITENSATISWITDELSDTRVNWSINPDLSFNSTSYNSICMTSHSTTLFSLNPNQTYYFEVTSVDGYGNLVTDNNGSQYYRFTTLPQDIIAPIISEVSIIPSPQEIHYNVNISVYITDNRQVYGARINITNSIGSTVGNYSMIYDQVNDGYYHNSTFSILGTYTFIIWASDASNNWNSTQSTPLQFVIQDKAIPLITYSVSPPRKNSGRT